MLGVIIVLIICLTVLAGIYMYCCLENDAGIFEPLKYMGRIDELEKKVKELEKQK